MSFLFLLVCPGIFVGDKIFSFIYLLKFHNSVNKIVTVQYFTHRTWSFVECVFGAGGHDRGKVVLSKMRRLPLLSHCL